MFLIYDIINVEFKNNPNEYALKKEIHRYKSNHGYQREGEKIRNMALANINHYALIDK